ncbi:hypothetical protein [Sandaracinus amylolyticus]|uniref:hypothetical protein n=1 Tax=Sandaracinus amylolyticus TaxID=927083 RepID=UPI001F3A8DDE|nr:hypothetical protein [Sandaracinus amylolyticus]UJR82119.1 Hypothetical protein I5071_41840 [Sandaracinus amylolyticus]
MQLPSRDTPIARCVTLSAFAQAALRRYATLFDATPDVRARLESLAGTLADVTTTLTTQQAAYEAAALALIGPRVEVKLVDLHADTVVRSVKRAADDAGVGSLVFPAGMQPIVKPVGATEVAALRTLEGRIASASAWADRELQRARIAAVRAEYDAALLRRRDARAAAADARALRDDAKESFLDAYAAVAAAIKELFPRDRPRQDVFFDEARAARGEADDDEEPAPAT